MSRGLLFAALCLASYRAWRLVGRDSITASLRSGLRGKLLEFVTCEWCLGTWIAIAATYATHRFVTPLEPHWFMWAMSDAAAVGLLGVLDEKLSG